MKYLIILLVFILSLAGAGYYLYTYDKKPEQVSNVSDKMPVPISDTYDKKQEQIPEHLTEDFWKSATPESLKEKLKTISNINEVRLDNKKSMLHLAVEHSQYPEMADLLMTAGIDHLLVDNPEGEDGFTALDRAFSSYEWTKEILKHMSNVNESLPMNEDPELGARTYLLSAIPLNAPIEVIELLLKKGANPNFQAPGTSRISVLILASRKDLIGKVNPKVIQLLLDYKANIKTKDSEGKTACDYMKEDEEFIQTKLFQSICS